ncbi:dATP/dGTP pyrophosphohydrolase domain-containing protein [Klebsiella variicola]|uniref:dATP/dGTP pyrophosphohydrolase domain-containing protein n=1 Tax=Klebsiella variicola TaxID=244366 RepID=UPI0035B50E75
MLPAEEAEELARIALDAMDRDQVRNEHAEWSQATFGNVGPVGPLKHLSKEALEAAAAPDDLSEWADMQFLLWDAQHRSGIADEQITQAMIEKLAVNKQRSWPEPKDGEPRLHINEQPALTGNFPIIGINLASGPDRTVEVSYVAPPGYVMVPKNLLSGLRDWAHPEIEEYCDMWAGRRDSELPALRKVIADADALLAAAPQLPGSEPSTVPGKWIPVSERIPIPGVDVLVAKEFFGPGDWRRKVGHVRHEESGWNIYGASWEPTHWMPLPAGPQEVR